jgi:hypothetical protein
VALLVWLIAAAARLRLVGYLPADADNLIPAALQPWMRFWLLTRMGLLLAMLLLMLATVIAAVARGPFHYCLQGFVYVVMLRIFMDLLFSAALNVGVIWWRNRDS